MKTKLLTTILALGSALCALSQIPQGFNYQAIARDGLGNILQNTELQVMLYIQSSSTGGTVFWKELYNPVTTNNFGLFTIIVGTGVRQAASTVATFDLIDWKVTPKYLKTEIYHSGSWKDMGNAAQLYSVPYAMAAKNLISTSKLDIKGTTSDMEEPLFEVKNKDSQTIFAVYNEGVRMWVSDGNKGTMGGFVLGGFNDNNFFDVSTEATGIINPSQNRILWYPLKNAFLTGKVLVENPDSVGENSFTSGYESKAIGQYSQALGYKAIARGEYSTAIGLNAVANNRNSFAFGEGTKAIGGLSTAIGYYTTASGLSSYANGYCSVASGNPSTALGSATLASGNFSTAMGFYSKARGSSTTAMGYNTDAPSYCETVIGAYNTIYVPLGEYEWKPTDRLFVIGNGTSSLRSDALTVLKSGNVGIGTSAPSAKLEILTSGFNAYAGIGLKSTLTGGKLITINQGTAGKLNFTVPDVVDLVTFDFVNSRVGIGTTNPGYTLTVNGTAWCTSGTWTGSDLRWKKNISSLNNALERILSLQGVVYEFKTTEYPEMGFESGKQIGLVAQELENIFPELVNTNINGFKAVAYDKLSVVLVEAIKEQQQQIESYKSQLQTLQEKVDKIEELLATSSER